MMIKRRFPRREARVYEGEKEVMGRRRSGSDGGVFGSGVLCVMRCVLGVRLLPWRDWWRVC